MAKMYESLADPKLEEANPECITITTLNSVTFFVQKKVKILVSPLVLSEASGPFAAMFSGRFLESGARGDAAPAIELPEDDALGMFQLCALLHHRKLANETLDPTALLNLTLLADKYSTLR